MSSLKVPASRHLLLMPGGKGVVTTYWGTGSCTQSTCVIESSSPNNTVYCTQNHTMGMASAKCLLPPSRRPRRHPTRANVSPRSRPKIA
eukprot:scaffold14592_cov130-Isochrysis_galbana.AAC.1